MIDRRSFLQSVVAGVTLAAMPVRASARRIYMSHEAVIMEVKRNHWDQLPIGELMGKIGELFITTEYVGGTLEGPGPEVCRVFYDRLDCVTYFELVLALSRAVKAGCWLEEHVVREVTRTRYRSGILDGYFSRLHYTSEWISDNVTKGIVEDITVDDGDAVVFKNTVNFMSTHPQYYDPLKNDPDLVRRIGEIEQRINDTTRWFVPKEKIASFEPRLRSGDIVAVATSKAGLDYAHTGMIRVDEDGRRRFMHASTTAKRVVLDDTISMYVKSVKAHTGITVVRPLEPSSTCDH